MAQISII